MYMISAAAKIRSPNVIHVDNAPSEKNEEIQELREEYERVYSMGCCDEIDTQLEEIQKRIDELYNSEAIVPVNDLPIYNRKIYVYADIIAELKEANANADKAYKKFEKYFSWLFLLPKLQNANLGKT